MTRYHMIEKLVKAFELAEGGLLLGTDAMNTGAV